MTAQPLKVAAARLYRRGAQVWWRIRKPVIVGVRGIVVDHGRVLLVRHTYVPGWHLPGGGVKRHESLEQAVRRELREEVGVVVGDGDGALRMFGAYTNMTEGKRDHIAVFLVERWERTPPPMPSLEIAEQGFHDLDALPDQTSPATRRRLEELAGRVPVRFVW